MGKKKNQRYQYSRDTLQPTNDPLVAAWAKTAYPANGTDADADAESSDGTVHRWASGSATDDTKSLGGSTSVFTPTHTTTASSAGEKTAEYGACKCNNNSSNNNNNNMNHASGPSSSSSTREKSSGAAPEAGGLYKIRHVDSGRILMVVEGKLVLRADRSWGPRGDSGSWWKCLETADGYLGFMELVSGTYLGRDGGNGFRASPRWSGWEHLLVRPREGGGCNIFAMRYWTLLGMKTAKDSDALVGSTMIGEAERWEFIQT